ncbi:MAG: ABC transporter permease, partial [Planctomycetota bacterium]
MEDALQISGWGVALAYLLLLFPAGLMLLWGMPLLGRSVLAVVRMTVQLLLVGFYLQFVFDLNSAWLNIAWLGVMVLVADASILRGSGLRLWRFAGPMFLG